MRGKLRDIYLTFDTDWCPGFILDRLVERISNENLNCTIFATNKSHALSALCESSSRVEIGLHPNFSESGVCVKSAERTLSELIAIFPDAKGVRTHRLIQWSGYLELAAALDLEYDSSIQLYACTQVQEFRVPSGLIRIPFIWSDATWIRNKSYDLFSLLRKIEGAGGLCVLDFHPILLAANCSNINDYLEIKRDFKVFTDIKETEFRRYINKTEYGVYNLFEDLLKEIRSRAWKTQCLRNLVR